MGILINSMSLIRNFERTNYKILALILFGIFLSLSISNNQDILAQAEEKVKIPQWVKNTAGWWSERTVEDSDFTGGIAYLIEEDIISIPDLPTATEVVEEKVPEWVRNMAGWWANDITTDQEFADAIKFLVEKGIVRSPKIKMSDEDILDNPEYEELVQISNKLMGSLGESTAKKLTADERISQLTDPAIDSDKDGIPDEIENKGWFGYKTDPNKADTDSDGLTDLREFWWNTSPTNPDSNGDFILDGDSISDPDKRTYPYADELSKGLDPDRDGIPTAAEMFDILTDHKKSSTDGDRYDDGTEFFGISTKDDFLPSYVAADPFTPATPDIVIAIYPDVIFNPGGTIKIGTKTLEKQDHTLTSSKENKANIFAAATTTHQFAYCAMSCGEHLGLRYEGDITLQAGVKGETTWSEKSEDRFFTSKEAYSIQNVVWGETTTLKMFFDIENIGNDVLTSSLKELTFNFYMGNDDRPFETKSITEGGVDLKTFENIEPGQTVGPMTIKDIKLNLQNVKRFLAGEGVRVELVHYSFGDDQVYLLNAAASNLQMIIESDNRNEKRYVPITSGGMNIEQVLKAADLTYTRNTDGAFTEIGGMETQLTGEQYTVLSIHHMPELSSSQPTTVDEMRFHNGDILVIKHDIDSDRDFLTDRHELSIGTNPNKADTDGDGLWDGYSFPSQNIVGELGTFEKPGCTHPLLRDTDGDGKNDLEDTNPCEKPQVQSVTKFAVGKNADGRLELFVITEDDTVWNKSQKGPNDREWQDWTNLGGDPKVKEITVGQNADGRLELFVIRDNNNKEVWGKSQEIPNGWSDWGIFGGIEKKKVVVGKNEDRRLEFFTIGGNNEIWHRFQVTPNGPNWSDWGQLGGDFQAQDIVVGQNSDGRLELFAIKNNNEVWHKYQEIPNGAWSDWNIVGGFSGRELHAKKIAVGQNADSRLSLFAIKNNNEVWHNSQNYGGGPWSDWGQFSGTLEAKDILVTNRADGMLQLFVIRNNGSVWSKWTIDNWNWNDWIRMAG